jgi:hypothetical protein
VDYCSRCITITKRPVIEVARLSIGESKTIPVTQDEGGATVKAATG